MSIQGDRSFSVLRDLYLKVSRSKSRFQDKPLDCCLFRNDAFDFNRSVIILYAIRVSTHRIAPLYREYYINDRTEFFHFCDTLLGIRLNDFLVRFYITISIHSALVTKLYSQIRWFVRQKALGGFQRIEFQEDSTRCAESSRRTIQPCRGFHSTNIFPVWERHGERGTLGLP